MASEYDMHKKGEGFVPGRGTNRAEGVGASGSRIKWAQPCKDVQFKTFQKF